jgi:hypothetical protein
MQTLTPSLTQTACAMAASASACEDEQPAAACDDRKAQFFVDGPPIA